MDITADGRRDSQFAVCVSAAGSYGLSTQQGREVVDRQVAVIRESWDEAADKARLPADNRRLMWGRQVLDPYAFDGYR